MKRKTRGCFFEGTLDTGAKAEKPAYMNNREDLGDRGTLSSELAIDRGVLALDALPQAQEFSVIARTGDLQVGLPSAHVDYLF